MKEFTVNLANRPGMLASLTETLAEAGVTIEALAAFGLDDEGYVRVIVDNAEATRQALSAAGLSATERPVLTTTLSHQPTSLSTMTRSLANSGVNIDAMYLLNSCADGLEFAVAVDEPERARPYLAS
ncbi:MAG: ACT domain-containing protein [Acidimicrobiia bacterium]|nr:ACT domain-containing protein [Acidimicrobiia bacterium]